MSPSRGCCSHKSAERSKQKGKKLDGKKRGNHRQLYTVLLEADFRKSSGMDCKLIVCGLEAVGGVYLLLRTSSDDHNDQERFSIHRFFLAVEKRNSLSQYVRLFTFFKVLTTKCHIDSNLHAILIYLCYALYLIIFTAHVCQN